MYIAVQRIISCQKLLERHIDEFEPCKVVVSKDLPIDIVLDTKIYCHKENEYIVVGDKKTFIQQICMAKLNTYVEKNTLYKEAVLLIEKELDVNDTLRMYKNDDIRMYNFNCITDTIVEVITTCNTYTLLTVHLL